MPQPMDIRPPQTPAEFGRYFELRWEILRAPWQQAKGSEQDAHEATAFHIMALAKDGRIMAVGRLHAIGKDTGQIRYMAVRAEVRGQGLGGRILQALEEEARRSGYTHLTLNARDTAVAFYGRHSYISSGPGETLYNAIPHTRMTKSLSP